MLLTHTKDASPLSRCGLSHKRRLNYPTREGGLMSLIMEEHSTTKASLRRLWHWLKDQIVQEVPEDIGLCEYDCRKKQCIMGRMGDVRPAHAQS